MAEISVSIGLARAPAIQAMLAAEEPLRDGAHQLLGSLGDKSVLDTDLCHYLLWVGRVIPITSETGTLLDQNVQTGDIVAAIRADTPSQPAPERSARRVLVCSIEDSGRLLEVSNDFPLVELWGDLFPLLGGEKLRDAPADQYALWAGRAVGSLSSTVGELGIEDGSLIGLTRLAYATTKTALLLQLPDAQQVFWVDRAPAVMGRHDQSHEKKVDIDLTVVLQPRQQRRVSRLQAILHETNGQWSIQLHPQARAPMFVDSRIVKAEPVLLNEGDVLSFGPHPNRPTLQLVVRFESD